MGRGDNKCATEHGGRTPDLSQGNQGSLPGRGDSQVIPESGIAWVRVGGGQDIPGQLPIRKDPQPLA